MCRHKNKACQKNGLLNCKRSLLAGRESSMLNLVLDASLEKPTFSSCSSVKNKLTLCSQTYSRRIDQAVYGGIGRRTA
jgi:hypothetical protein